MSSFIVPRTEQFKLRDNRPIIFLDDSHNFNSIKLHISIGNVSTLALLDTGAEVSVMSDVVFASLNPLYVHELIFDNTSLRVESNNTLDVIGYYRIFLSLPDIASRIEHNFYIVPNLRSNCILGLDFIRDKGIVIDGNVLKLLDSKSTKTVLTKTISANPFLASVCRAPVLVKTFKFKINLSHLTKELENIFLTVFEKYRGIFAKSMMDLGKTNLISHEITLTDSIPVYTPPYVVPFNQRPFIKRHLQEMIQNGIICESTSPYSSSVVLVKKKNGEIRFCVDFRKLNSKTIKDPQPIPRIQDLTSYFKGAKIFSTIDLFSGFWQIEVDEKDRYKTAFTCDMGHYHFIRLPMGLCNSPATFQRLMQTVLGPVLHQFALVYLDDIIIYSDTMENHIIHLETVLELLHKAGLKIKLEKCEFVMTEIIYLGHIISSEGIRPNPKKIEAVSNYPAPVNVNQLRTFLGLANYYRRYIKDFAKIAHPLTELTKKNKAWIWEAEQDYAFNALKFKLTSSPILGHPDLHTAQYFIDTDASQYCVGGVLSQIQNLADKVIAYTSRHLNEQETNWSTFEKELFAVKHSVETFRTYVHGTKIIVRSDHKPLEKTLDKPSPNEKVARWKLYLNSYDIDIIHRPGKLNQNADALSRIPKKVDLVPSISVIMKGSFPSKEEFICAQQKDEYCLRKQSPNRNDGMNLITSKGKIIVPLILINRVIERFHDHILGGHLGITKTAKRISQKYFWPQMIVDITNYINSCLICAKRKAYGKRMAPLKPLEPSLFFWQRIAMDIVGPLPETYSGNRYILVMSEYATRYMIAVAMKDQKAKTVAKHFIINVILKYGSPLQILTDQGKNFLSNLMKDICSLLNIKQTRTTAYHPATDGNVERFNRTMGDMLATGLSKDINRWDEYLPFVIYIYNTSVHTSTNETPHYLLYGQDPIEPDDISSDTARKRCIDEGSDEFFSIWRNSIEIAQDTFRKSQNSQKKFYDTNKHEKSFAIGDKVLLLDFRLRSKFSPKWDGPYVITRKMSPLNYTVRRETSLNHSLSTSEFVVHVNRMKLLPERHTQADFNLLANDEFQKANRETVIQQSNNLSIIPYTETLPDEYIPQENAEVNTDNIDSESDKENIEPIQRSEKSRYNLRNKTKKPKRYGINE